MSTQNLYNTAQNKLVKKILCLPPGLKEQIITEATHMDRIEIEERVYDRVYEELRNNLSNMVINVLRKKLEQGIVKEADFFGDPYHFELADEITSEILSEHGHTFIQNTEDQGYDYRSSGSE